MCDSNPDNLDNKLFAISAESGAKQKPFKSIDLKGSKLVCDPYGTELEPVYQESEAIFSVGKTLLFPQALAHDIIKRKFEIGIYPIAEAVSV